MFHLARKISVQSQSYERIFCDFVFADDGSIRLGIYPLMVMGLLSPRLQRKIHTFQDLINELNVSCGSYQFDCFDEFGPQRKVATVSIEDFHMVFNALRKEENESMREVAAFIKDEAFRDLDRLQDESGIHNMLFSFWDRGSKKDIVAHRDKRGNFWWRATEIGELLGLEANGHKITRYLAPDMRCLMSAEQFRPPAEARAAKSLECNSLGLPVLHKDTSVLNEGRRVVAINEPGLYMLIFRSEKPEAEKFKSWLAKEVIPSIRKNGSYSTGISDVSRIPSIYKRDIAIYRDNISKLESCIEHIQEQLQDVQNNIHNEFACLKSDFSKTISGSRSFTEWDNVLKKHAVKLRESERLLKDSASLLQIPSLDLKRVEPVEYDHRNISGQCNFCGSINKINPNCFYCSRKHEVHASIFPYGVHYRLIPAAEACYIYNGYRSEEFEGEESQGIDTISAF